MEEEKEYCIIKQSEYKELLNKGRIYESLERKYNDLKNTLDEKVENNSKIKVEFGAVLTKDLDYLCVRPEVLKKKIINYIYCMITPSKKGVTIEGDLRGKLHEIKEQVLNELKYWISEYIESKINRDYNEKIRNQDLLYKKLENKIKDHNSKWYNFHKIKID